MDECEWDRHPARDRAEGSRLPGESNHDRLRVEEYDVVEREPEMYRNKRVRFSQDQWAEARGREKKGKRAANDETDEYADADIDIGPGVHAACKACLHELKRALSPVQMAFNVAKQLRYVIPPKKVRKIEPGNLYVRRHGKGSRNWEFVRKRESCCEDTRKKCCKDCEYGKGKGKATMSNSAGEHAALNARIRRLQADIAVTEEREVLKRIGERERQPYHSGGDSKREDSPTSSGHGSYERKRPSYAHDAHDGARRKQHSYRYYYASEDQRPSYHYYDNSYTRRPSYCWRHHHYAYQPPMYHIPDNCPPSPRQRHDRGKHLTRSHQDTCEDVPVLHQSIQIPRRRTSGFVRCHKHGRACSWCYTDTEIETRTPGDYYF